MVKILDNLSIRMDVSDLHDIIRYEGCQNYIRVHKENGITMLSEDKLKDINMKLESIFYQCHKSHVVNLEKVVRYHKNGFLELSNGSIVPVARRKRAGIQERLGKWLVERETMFDKLPQS